jgi:hypothetical protein
MTDELPTGALIDATRRTVSDTLIELAANACASAELLSTLDFRGASHGAIKVALDDVRDAGLLLIMLERRLRLAGEECA